MDSRAPLNSRSSRAFRAGCFHEPRNGSVLPLRGIPKSEAAVFPILPSDTFLSLRTSSPRSAPDGAQASCPPRFIGVSPAVKLRKKAVAAQVFSPPHSGQDARAPSAFHFYVAHPNDPTQHCSRRAAPAMFHERTIVDDPLLTLRMAAVRLSTLTKKAGKGEGRLLNLIDKTGQSEIIRPDVF